MPPPKKKASMVVCMCLPGKKKFFVCGNKRKTLWAVVCVWRPRRRRRRRSYQFGCEKRKPPHLLSPLLASPKSPGQAKKSLRFPFFSKKRKIENWERGEGCCFGIVFTFWRREEGGGDVEVELGISESLSIFVPWFLFLGEWFLLLLPFLALSEILFFVVRARNAQFCTESYTSIGQRLQARSMPPTIFLFRGKSCPECTYFSFLLLFSSKLSGGSLWFRHKKTGRERESEGEFGQSFIKRTICCFEGIVFSYLCHWNTKSFHWQMSRWRWCSAGMK